MTRLDREFQRRLEVLSDQAMPGFERSMLGSWVMRAGVGATGRANSAWPVGDPGVGLSTAVDIVERWYVERGLRCGFQLYAPGDPSLRAVLVDRSYVETPGAIVMWAPLSKIIIDTDSPRFWTLQMTSTIDSQLAQLIGDPGRVREISAGGPESQYLAALDQYGQLLGGGKSHRVGDSVGIFAMLTAESARRQGVARAVLNRLLSQARDNGATWAWLQVTKTNHPAIALYEAVGFEAVHSYEYMFGPSC